MLKFIMTRSIALVLLCSLSVSAYAVANGALKRPINIPSEDLATALEQLSKQSGTDLVYRPEQVRGLSTHGLVGEFSAEEAVAKLLEGTPLTFSTDPSGAMLIAAPSASTAVQASPVASADGRQEKEGKKSSSSGFRVAQVDQGQAAGDSSVEKQEEEQASKKKRAQLEEVIVTGSRIPTVGGQQAMPVRSYTRENIEQSGQTTVAGFLNNLPDVSTSSYEDGSQSGFPGRTTVQLHGLPIGTTLVLLNGRRLEPSILGFFDLSSIPATAIDRVEVLPVGASSIYGADALGGAVNIVMRENFNGFEADGKFGQARGMNDTSANFGWGKSWKRGSISLLGSYQNNGELLGSQREPTSATQFPAGAPTFLYVADDCSPGNVYSLTGQNLPGLSSPQAGIPTGISGAPTQQQFVATAGMLNQCNFNRTYALVPRSEREGALASAHYQVVESMDLFAEILFSHEQLRASVGLVVDASAATLAANNPYNPFGEDVAVSFVYPGIRQVQDNSGTLIRPLIGMRGLVFSDWRYEATAYLSHDRFQSDYTSGDSNALQAALSSPDSATALNPFTTGAPGTPQLLRSFESTSPDLAISQIVDGQATLRGPLLHLPAGSLEVVIGSEYSQEREYQTFPGRTRNFHRNSYGVFSETRIPLLANHEQQSGDRLALSVAGRYDHSSDFGGKATWQSGLLWQATESLLLSGSYGVSYKAPQLKEIDGIQTIRTGHTGAVDPFRGGQPVPVTAIVSGSNPKLQPETGNSRTLGIVYSSQAVHGLRGSLSYFAVNISNYIATHFFQDLVDNPGLFPGAVVRGPATPQDQQQGFLGPITQINNIYYNFGDLHVAGFDADASYAIDTDLGQLTPSLAITNIYKWQSALASNAPVIGYVSQAGGSPGWAPRWKGTAALGWKRGPLSANLTGRYVGRYKDYQYVTNTNELGNFWILDLNARFELGRALPARRDQWLAGAYLAVGAINLFDKPPQFSNGSPPYDSSQFDIRGRLVYVQFGTKW